MFNGEWSMVNGEWSIVKAYQIKALSNLRDIAIRLFPNIPFIFFIKTLKAE
jgi:hypothetical protein